MNETHVYVTKQLRPQLDNALQFRLNRITQIKDFQ